MSDKFFILAYARTGSYALTSLLGSANDVVCHGEIFKQNVLELQPWAKKKFGEDFGPEQRDAEPVKFLAKLQRMAPAKVFGFKAFPQHLTRVNLRERLLESSDWKKVVLTRDPLEVYASLLRARATGIWVLKEGRTVSSEVLNARVEFSEDTWLPFVQSYSRFIDLGRSAPNSIAISYDQLGPTPRMAEVLLFIGSKAPVESLQVSVQKQYKGGSVADAFSNWSEFSDYLNKHPLAQPGL